MDENVIASGVLTPAGYRPRVVDAEMHRALRTMPAVIVEGPRGCGKTWTARRFAGSAVYLDEHVDATLTAGMSSASILGGEVPRLIDEWQLAPSIWNPVRRACDSRGQRGQFILTGSADPPDDITRHSGAGRIVRVRMRPMSLHESGESDGTVSLEALLDGRECAAADPGFSLGDVFELACRGGWPYALDSAPHTAADAARAYLGEISRTDMSRVDVARQTRLGPRGRTGKARGRHRHRIRLPAQRRCMHRSTHVARPLNNTLSPIQITHPSTQKSDVGGTSIPHTRSKSPSQH